MMSTARRIVITGVGQISPLGSSKDSLWQALAEKRSGVTSATAAESALPTRVIAPAAQFTGDISDFGTLEKEQKKAIRKGLKVMCRECQMGVAVAQLALADAQTGMNKVDPERTGISYGADYMLSIPEEFTEGILQCLDAEGRFEFSRWGAEGMTKMSPLWLLKYLPNMPASHLAIYNDFRGPNNSLTLREASFNAALGEAYQIILRGHADTMLVGATGTRLHPMKAIHAVQQEEVVTDGDPQQASRPFDLNRRGEVLGEGAGAIVLEELATAQARGAAIYGEVLAAASTSVAGRHLVADRKQAIINVLAAVLRSSGLGANDIGHLHAHGLSTRTADAEEAAAINQVFGQRTSPLPVTAAKSYFGNLGAGSSAVELIASLLAMQNERLFPVLNYTTPDPECAVAAVTDSDATPGETFVNVNVTPQGQASAALIRRF